VSLHYRFKNSPHFLERLWDVFCIASIVGIWPRFIEPNLLFSSEHIIPVARLPHELNGLSIVHLTDLHFSSYSSPAFLKRILKKTAKLNPHLILFTGDLISYAELGDKEALFQFLSSFSCPLGCYAILGNHDYSQYVSLGSNGKFCIMEEHVPPLLQGLFKLISSKSRGKEQQVTKPIPAHPELRALFEKAGWTLLENETVRIGTARAQLNITGLGDIMAAHFSPQEAFAKQDGSFPTIVMAHNPDCFPYLKNYPFDLALAGHTHGGQVNLPFIWKRITPILNKQFKSGLKNYFGKFLYISRGLGAVFPFRWFAPPEIAKFTLINSSHAPVQSYAFDFARSQVESFAANRSSCSKNPEVS